MKYSILYKLGGLLLITFAYYSWEMALNVGHDLSFDDI
jgi:hypothetical protein